MTVFVRLRLPLILGVCLLAACESGQQARVEAKLEQATALVENLQPGAALQLADAVLRQQPDNPAALLVQARAHELGGDIDAAIAAYGRYIGLKPDAVAGRVGRARVLLAGRRVGAARSDVEHARALAPAAADVLLLRAGIAAAEGRIERARGLAEAVLAVYPDHLDGYVLLAQLVARDEGYDAALDQLEMGLRQAPESIALWRASAALAIASGRTDDTLRALARVRELAPRSPVAVHQLALALHRDRRAGEALELLRDRLRAYPEEKTTLALLAEFRLASATTTEARAEALAGLVETYGDLPALRFVAADVALQHGETARAQDLLDDLADVQAEEAVVREALKKLAGIDLAVGDRASAATRVARLLRIDPQDADGLIARAALALDAGDAPAAIDDLERALQRQPGSIQGVLLITRAHLADDRPAAGVMQLERMIEHVPPRREVYLAIADMQASAGRSRDAERVLQMMAEAFPGDAEALRRLVDHALARNDLVAALEAAEALRAADPQQPDGDYAVGRVLEASAAYDDAARAYTAALDKREDAVEPLTALVRVRLAQGRGDDAARDLERRLQRDPENYVALNLLGELLRRAGDDERALAMFQRAASINPRWAAPYINAADTLAARGQTDAAIAQLRAGLAETGGARSIAERITRLQNRDG